MKTVKQAMTLRLTVTARRLIEALAEAEAVSMAKIVEDAVRQYAKKRQVEPKETKE